MHLNTRERSLPKEQVEYRADRAEQEHKHTCALDATVSGHFPQLLYKESTEPPAKKKCPHVQTHVHLIRAQTPC